MRRTGVFVARVAWLILPVIAAGLVHVVVLKTDLLGCLTIPIDGGRYWRARPLLGPNKTWRGVLVMSLLTAVFTHAQSLLARERRGDVLGVTHDFRWSPWIAGSVLGLGYCLAELPNSFLKRRLGISPGGHSTRHTHIQYIGDQIDSVIGCLVALRLVYRPRRGEMALAFVLGAAVHIGVDRLMYRIGLKRHAW